MITIQKAAEEDLAIVLDLLQKQFAEHQIEVDEETLTFAIREELRNEKLGIFLIARQDARPVGFAAIVFTWTLEHGGNVAWLEELYVLPELRNDGIGSQLVDAVIAETSKLGCRAIDLEVEEEHERAENLYHRKGFHLLNRRRWAKKLV
jgi:GNAT superfamily N-acetyltransferase